MPLTVPAYQNWKMCMRYEIFPIYFPSSRVLLNAAFVFLNTKFFKSDIA